MLVKLFVLMEKQNVYNFSYMDLILFEKVKKKKKSLIGNKTKFFSRNNLKVFFSIAFKSWKVLLSLRFLKFFNKCPWIVLWCILFTHSKRKILVIICYQELTLKLYFYSNNYLPEKISFLKVLPLLFIRFLLREDFLEQSLFSSGGCHKF